MLCSSHIHRGGNMAKWCRAAILYMLLCMKQCDMLVHKNVQKTHQRDRKKLDAEIIANKTMYKKATSENQQQCVPHLYFVI